MNMMWTHDIRRMACLLGAGLVTCTAATIQAAPEPYESRTVSVMEDGAAVEFRYRLMRPRDVDRGGGERHPLVLFLHGAGERGNDNEKQLLYLPTWLADDEARRTHPCFVLAPQCRAGSSWADVDWASRTSAPQRPEPTVDLAAAVAALDDVMRAEAVDPQRVYLTGLSMGGYGAWDLAARSPDRFAAVIPICGGGDESTAPRLKAVPIWCFHGAADTVVPVERSRSMVAAVRAAGGNPRFTEFEGVGHDSWTPAYRDRAVLDWLFRQKR